MVSTRCQNPKRRPRGPEFDSRRLHRFWGDEEQIDLDDGCPDCDDG